MKDYKFILTGGISLKGAEPQFNCRGEIMGFRLKNGQQISPIISFELWDGEIGCKFLKSITSEKDMDRLGITDLCYDETEFYEI